MPGFLFRISQLLALKTSSQLQHIAQYTGQVDKLRALGTMFSGYEVIVAVGKMLSVLPTITKCDNVAKPRTFHVFAAWYDRLLKDFFR